LISLNVLTEKDDFSQILYQESTFLFFFSKILFEVLNQEICSRFSLRVQLDNSFLILFLVNLESLFVSSSPKAIFLELTSSKI